MNTLSWQHLQLWPFSSSNRQDLRQEITGTRKK